MPEWMGGGKKQFIACSTGTKVEVNDWGTRNWQQLLQRLSQAYQSYGLVLIGAGDEFVRSERASRDWSGPKLNLCGILTPRESAAVPKRAAVFVGHDNGPLHPPLLLAFPAWLFSAIEISLACGFHMEITIKCFTTRLIVMVVGWVCVNDTKRNVLFR